VAAASRVHLVYRMQEVVYIAGHGHSGSTLLDLILGSHSKIESVGEVTEASVANVLRGEELCTCGRRFSDCEYWSVVVTQLHQRGMDSADAILASPQVFIFEAIRQSGKAIYAESTKSADRLRRLLATPHLNVRVVHIVRDPRATAFSFAKKYGRIYRRARKWSELDDEINQAVEPQRRLVVRYEALVTCPVEQIRRVMTFIGEDFEPGQLAFLDRIHHNISGNRMRYSGHSQIWPDTAYLRSINRAQWLTLTMLCLGSLRKYGYAISRTGMSAQLVRRGTGRTP
jgi:hypothetical protein